MFRMIEYEPIRIKLKVSADIAPLLIAMLETLPELEKLIPGREPGQEGEEGFSSGLERLIIDVMAAVYEPVAVASGVLLPDRGHADQRQKDFDRTRFRFLPKARDQLPHTARC